MCIRDRSFTGVVLTLYFSASISVASDSVSASTGSASSAAFGTLGDWLCLASSAVLGYRLIISAIIMKKIDSYRLAFWPVFLSVPVFFVLGGIFESVDWAGFKWTAVAGIAYQGVVVAGVGFMVSLWLMSRYRPSLMAGFNFIAPVSGVLLSVLLLGERFSAAIAVGVGLSLIHI